MKFSRLLIFAVAAGSLCMLPAKAAAYDDYEDDIYYNADKAREKAEKKAEEQRQKQLQQQQAAAAQRSAAAYVPNKVVEYDDPANTVIANGSGLNVDVDAYNRRGQFLVSDTIVPSEASGADDTYAYTRRIERFYNGDIVNGSGNQALIDSYYSTEPINLNVYVVNPNPYSYYGWYSPWNSWAWNSLYWNSWYYGPSWSWSWYNPWYSWSWGWGPSWGWHGPGWGWGGPSWGWGGGWHPGWHPGPGGPRPGGGGNWAVNNPGASRPHTPVGSTSTVGRRPGAFSAGANNSYTRPGNMGRPSTGTAGNVNTSRPGTTVGTTRPATTPSTTAPSVNTQRGRTNSSSSSGTVRQSTQSRPSSSSSPSYRSSGGSSSGYSGGGANRSGGGGAGRGRR